MSRTTEQKKQLKKQSEIITKLKEEKAILKFELLRDTNTKTQRKIIKVVLSYISGKLKKEYYNKSVMKGNFCRVNI